MTFKLADEEYGIEILTVREIIGLMEVTRVPRVAPFVRGVINLRGKVIPVIDLKLKFEIERTETHRPDRHHRGAIHPRRNKTSRWGSWSTKVLEVLDIKPQNIEPPPAFGGISIDTEFILGIGKHAERVIFLLNIAKVLSAAEVTRMVQTTDKR